MVTVRTLRRPRLELDRFLCILSWARTGTGQWESTDVPVTFLSVSDVKSNSFQRHLNFEKELTEVAKFRVPTPDRRTRLEN